MRASTTLLIVVLCSVSGCKGQDRSPAPPDASGPETAASNYPLVYAAGSADSSRIYIKRSASSEPALFMKGSGETQSDPALAPDNLHIAFTRTVGNAERSEVWVAGVDGSDAHRVSSDGEDAMMPAFGADPNAVYYVHSGSFGHHSPIARPRRHDFDVMKTGIAAGSAPVQITHQNFYDFHSLSVNAEGNESLLISTNFYPLGDVIEEVIVKEPFRIAWMQQPHVPNQPTSGPVIWRAYRAGQHSTDIVFAAASEVGNGGFDYNLYKMSGVTGADIVQLTHRKGRLKDFMVGRGGAIFTVETGKWTEVKSAP